MRGIFLEYAAWPTPRSPCVTKIVLSELAAKVFRVSKGDDEVDIVIEQSSGAVLGIEVKASATVRARDFRGLVRMRELLGDRLLLGVVIYAGEQTLPFGDRLWALPLEAFWAR